ncbi:MAG: hypothetical protein GXO55_00565 [Chloroflexi bacterium]|nr:hypothetical protein [Chloroflexota bacterium]
MRKGGVIVSLVLVFVLVGIVGGARGEQGTGMKPAHMTISPGEAEIGRTLHVSFWGAVPNAFLEVEAYPQKAPDRALRFWVRVNDSGAGRFTLGVPCTWEAGPLVVLRVGDMEMHIPLVNARGCERLRDWLMDWKRTGGSEGNP